MFCDKYKKELEQKEKEILEYKAIIEKLLQHCEKSFTSQQRLITALQQKRANQIENALKNGTMSRKGAEKAQRRFLNLIDEVYGSIIDENDNVKEFIDNYNKM